MSLALDLRVKRPAVAVPPSDWGWKSEADVIRYMLDKSGLQRNTVAIEIGIDNSTLAKVVQGTARLPEDALQRLMDCTGSEAWLIYQLLRRNKDPKSVRILETEHERRERELQEKVDKLEHEKAVLVEALTGRAAA